MDAPPPTSPAALRPSWTREWPLVCVVLLVLAIYFTRVDALTIRGEESRRATVAMEMIATGDWIVPRQQGETKFMSSRPPIHNWLIACSALARGQLDAVAVRLPSVLAVLITAVFLYAYTRQALSPLGAAAAALSYATFGQILELGRLGETDAVFTLCLSSAMLTWHWGHTQGWPAWKTWTLAYALAALATLTKGPQAPVYFAASIGLYLLVVRQWRFAVSRAHLAGIAVYTLIFSAWFVPFAASVGWDGVKHTFAGDVQLYFADWSFWSVCSHYTSFPLSILFGSLLPWSLLLVVWLHRGFRERLGPAAPYALFAAGALLICLPSVWLIPSTRTRFVVSLYPCFAVLVGIAVEGCARVTAPEALQRVWRHYLAGMTALIGLGALTFPILKLAGPAKLAEGQSWTFVAMAASIAAGLAAVCWYARSSVDEARRTSGVLAIGGFAGLLFAGVFTNVLIAKSERMDLAMHEFEANFPPQARMVSLRPVFHLFPYYHGRIIPVVREAADSQLAEADYFCFDGAAAKGPPFTLDRPYEIVGEFYCNRERTEQKRPITVGRFVPVAAAQDSGATRH